MGKALLAAGALDRRVTIVRATVASTNDYGEPVPGDPIETTKWASARPAPGTERYQNAQNAAEIVMRFVFRFEAELVPLTATLRLDGVNYDVKSVIEIGRREGLEVLAVAIV
jgi:SPP1 family predicted phage head-tail adaptor